MPKQKVNTKEIKASGVGGKIMKQDVLQAIANPGKKVFAEGSLNKDQKIRYRFILGQLYSLANDNINA
jgi:hypothetical protein